MLRATDGLPTSVASSATSVPLLPLSRTGRATFSVYNESNQVMYLLNGAGTASPTVYTTQVNPGGLYECPISYCGAVNAAWASANGNARITEYV